MGYWAARSSARPVAAHSASREIGASLVAPQLLPAWVHLGPPPPPWPRRWFGTWVVAAFSMVAVFREAGRMQRWARLVLFRLAQRQRKQQGKTDAPAATAPAATAAATVGVAAAAAAGPLAAVEGNGVGKGQPAAASKEHKEAEDEEEEEEEDIGPLEGLAFTDVQRPLNSINIARTLDGYSVRACVSMLRASAPAASRVLARHARGGAATPAPQARCHRLTDPRGARLRLVNARAAAAPSEV